MSDTLAMTCQACGGPLGRTHHFFGFQNNLIAYEREGDTPSEQAVLYPLPPGVYERFCSASCCESQLPRLLDAQSIPPQFQHHRVYGGPLEPCGVCGKWVNLAQDHLSWVKGQITVDGSESLEMIVPDWVDVLTVFCKSCTGSEEADDETVADDRDVALSATPPTSDTPAESRPAPARPLLQG